MSGGNLVIELDAADRLILDEALRDFGDSGEFGDAAVLVVGSLPLALGARATGADRVRVWFDSIADRQEAVALGFDVGEDARGIDVVLLRLPKSLRELDSIARGIAATSPAGVIVFGGGRLKYMTTRMNDVLLESFERVDVSLARQKSRVLIARVPRAVSVPEPTLTNLDELGLVVGSVGGVFARDGLDAGARTMLAEFGGLPDFESAIDFGCGTGILAAELKLRRPSATVIASDVSADAVASARATMLANGLDVAITQEPALAGQPDASADLIVLNPPFHDGGPVSTALAGPLFVAAARVLRGGGELWTVFNSSLGYRSELERVVGPTRQLARTAKFTVTASVRR